jgi:hypothetical protein
MKDYSFISAIIIGVILGGGLSMLEPEKTFSKSVTAYYEYCDENKKCSLETKRYGVSPSRQQVIDVDGRILWGRPPIECTVYSRKNWRCIDPRMMFGFADGVYEYYEPDKTYGTIEGLSRWEYYKRKIFGK